MKWESVRGATRLATAIIGLLFLSSFIYVAEGSDRDILVAVLGDSLFLFAGVVLIRWAKPAAREINRWTVAFYEKFPKLKKLPNSRYAGTELNYRVMFIWFRVCGAVMVVSGIYFLALTMRLVWK